MAFFDRRKLSTSCTTRLSAADSLNGSATSMMTLCASWPCAALTALAALSHPAAHVGVGAMGRYICQVLSHFSESIKSRRQIVFREPCVPADTPHRPPAVSNQNQSAAATLAITNRDDSVPPFGVWRLRRRDNAICVRPIKRVGQLHGQ